MDIIADTVIQMQFRIGVHPDIVPTSKLLIERQQESWIAAY